MAAMALLRNQYIPRLRLLGQAFADALSRARGEATLRRAEQTLAAAQRIAQTGSYERDIATGEFTVSAEAQRILGVQPGQNMMFLSCVHPEGRTKVEALLEPVVAGARRPMAWNTAWFVRTAKCG